MVRATRTVEMHGSSNEPIPDNILRYGSADVYLLVHHSGRMTWRVWETALRAIADFVERYEYVEMEFDVGQKGMTQYWGTGVLGTMRDQE